MRQEIEKKNFSSIMPIKEELPEKFYLYSGLSAFKHEEIALEIILAIVAMTTYLIYTIYI